MRLRYTLPALADLDDLLSRFASQSPAVVRRIRGWIDAREALLVRFPRSGRQTRVRWLRRIAAPPYPYMIFYEIGGDEIVVHAIRDSRRDPATMPAA